MGRSLSHLCWHGGGGARAGCVTIVLPRLRVRLRLNSRKNLGARSTCVGSLTRKKMCLAPAERASVELMSLHYHALSAPAALVILRRFDGTGTP